MIGFDTSIDILGGLARAEAKAKEAERLAAGGNPRCIFCKRVIEAEDQACTSFTDANDKPAGKPCEPPPDGTGSHE